jgi:hypothetical protein
MTPGEYDGGMDPEQTATESTTSVAKDVLINTFIAIQATILALNDRPNLSYQQLAEILIGATEGMGEGISDTLNQIATKEDADYAELRIVKDKRDLLEILDEQFPS